MGTREVSSGMPELFGYPTAFSDGFLDPCLAMNPDTGLEWDSTNTKAFSSDLGESYPAPSSVLIPSISTQFFVHLTLQEMNRAK